MSSSFWLVWLRRGRAGVADIVAALLIVRGRGWLASALGGRLTRNREGSASSFHAKPPGELAAELTRCEGAIHYGEHVTLLAPDAPFHIVSNAGSGSKDAHEAREEIEAVLSAAGRPHEFILIEDPSKLASVAKRAVDAAVKSGGAVVAAGGDGTINSVVQAVLPTRRPFGIIPQGTFNYSSRAHGIPLDTTEATRSLLTSVIKPVQVGQVNERAFLVNASLGLYPELLQDREEYKRQYGRHRTVAMWSGLMTLMRQHRQLSVEIEHDQGRERVRTPSIFIGNNALQLEQVGLEEAEAVKRWRLAAVIVQPVGTSELIGLAFRGMLGHLGEDDRVRNFAFQSMTVRLLGGVSRRGIKVAVDGEIFWCAPPITFRVAPYPLMLMAPKSADQ